MLDAFGVIQSIRLFIYIMISFAFFVGILLLVSQEAFDVFSSDLQKEYGLKKRLFPKIEDSGFNFVDFLLLKYRFMAGILIAVIAFILLLVCK
ncbi:MAG: hypothetical protein WC552_07950 [Candidatus Omnitrophota bacterium]